MAERDAVPGAAARLLAALAPLLALGLLAAALAWRVPMPLWDHLDLVPMYMAWQAAGDAAQAGFWSIHGGHMHAAAYAVLLLTTWLSGGETWLDVLASWFLLLAWLGGLACIARRGGAPAWLHARGARPWALALLLFAFSPGHLANLQWGWQVAVFLCLAGAGASMALLAGGRVGWRRNAAALAAALLACLSFATGMAVIPVAMLLVLARPQATGRASLLLPWVALGAWASFHHAGATPEVATPTEYAAYVLNYLGSGLSRFSAEAAPWLAGASLVAVLPLALPRWRSEAVLPWLALIAFGIGCAALTAIGRAGSLGAEHAFVSRYVSFSSVYWVGWTGLAATLAVQRRHPGWSRAAVSVLLVLGLVNAIHMARQAQQVRSASLRTAAEIACDWPRVDEETLGRIYFGQPEVARERLAQWRSLGFAPFGGSVDCGD